ncbi:hypothetical protein C2E23DRAFT_944232 [Lenzites betulinus]|nr:hypothetical protein C2E23DRAFT_944232 [Lenzites betulinus]
MSLPILYRQDATPALPLYVTPRVSTTHPSPPGSTTLLFDAPFPSTHPLSWGQRVQLFLVNPLAHAPSTFHLPPGENYPAIPLAFKGTIAGERTRQEEYVEIVVTNENPLERARRAFIFVSAAETVMPPPNLADMITQRLRASARDASARGEAVPVLRPPLPALPDAPRPVTRRGVPVLHDLPRSWTNNEASARYDTRAPVVAGTPAPDGRPEWAGPLFPRDPVWAYEVAPGPAAVTLVGPSAPGATTGAPDAPALHVAVAPTLLATTPPDALPIAEPSVFYTTPPAGAAPPVASFAVRGEYGDGSDCSEKRALAAAISHSKVSAPAMSGMRRRGFRVLGGRRRAGYRRIDD